MSRRTSDPARTRPGRPARTPPRGGAARSRCRPGPGTPARSPAARSPAVPFLADRIPTGWPPAAMPAPVQVSVPGCHPASQNRTAPPGTDQDQASRQERSPRPGRAAPAPAARRLPTAGRAGTWPIPPIQTRGFAGQDRFPARGSPLPAAPAPDPVTDMAAPAGPGGRSTPPRAVRAANRDAAGQAGPGAPAGDAGPRGAAAGGPLPASRPRVAARACRPILGPGPPDARLATRIPAVAGCRVPAASAVDLAAGRRAAGGHAPCLPRSPGSRDRPGRRLLAGRSHAGTHRERRQHHLAGRMCLCQARCPDDSPGTSWSQRGALAIHQNECMADKSSQEGRRVIAAGSALFNRGGQRTRPAVGYLRVGLPCE
jgi:hypothetical protein